MEDAQNEDEQLRAVALQNANAIQRARQLAEQDLLRAQKALREATERLQLALQAGHLGDWSWDAKSDVVTLSDAAADIFGLPRNAPLTWSAMREVLDEADREAARLAVAHAAATGTDYDNEYRIAHSRHGQRWIAAKGRATYGSDGAVSGMTGVVQDITDRKRREEALRESEARFREEARILELLNKAGTTLAANLDLQTVVQAVTDAATEVSGAEFGAFFYNITDENGDALLLYTLSGAPREAFERFGKPRATPLFGPTFRGEAPIRSDDILADARYGKMGPHHGMPKGHLPVRSYLAAPVASRSGAVIGGLFFGHSRTGVFTDRHERLIVGIAAQAAIAIDNARLYETAQRAAEERRSLLDSERAARAEAERASASKDEFLATLSHELRTPLSAILGWAQLLRMTSRSEADLRTGLETIERNARIQTQLIEDLLDMSRITSGKVRLDVQPVVPMLFIEAAIDTVRPAAEAKNVRIEKVLDPAAGPVSGDPSRLQQVIWNLLSNAIKFTPKGGKVQIILERVNSHVEISVADTGIGIKPEFLPYVFERFRQADGSSTRAFAGLGLGLSIVRHLVELHGGAVQATSAGEGMGSTFSVSLPLTVVHRSGPVERNHPKASAAVPLRFDSADLAGVRVLVVDDERDARELIKRLLVECEAEVFAAATAEEALELARTVSPHVLISDIGMPNVDGYELLRRFRAADHALARVPAIALTAFARSEDRTRALRAGFLVHVSKPVEPAELVATVASVVGRASQQPS